MDGVFPKRKLTDKIVHDYELLTQAINGLKAVKHTIVVTIGSWDLLHIGHVRYLNEAKMHGDILVVGVDSDRAVRLSKGPLRPVVPQKERCEMLSYQSVVDFVALLDDVNGKGEWQYGLIRNLRPDVFIAEESSYSPKQLRNIRKYSKRVVVLKRQAKDTSTSKLIQKTVKKNLNHLLKKRK
ncbi:MAG: adenylyltransferase/cytidyltransferase family protein [Candidatus Colwellbacteria bacterium]|nr:adenylyltransferase/cytidyltransferase family protein [Candidatus Colwellbacteria bacterium]